MEIEREDRKLTRGAKVSVVIPAFNAGRFIRETLESVLAQTEVDLEVVVVDDGSDDNTLAIARSFGGCVKVIEGAHRGAQAARNAGLAATTAPLVKFLDADDVLLDGSLLRQVAQAGSLAKQSIPYGPARTMDAYGTIGGVLPHTAPRTGLHPIAHILFFSPLTSCPLHRRSLLEAVGGMDESLPREHENDLHIRLCLAGVRFKYDPEPVYAYRRHAAHKGLMSGGFDRFGTDWMLDYLRMQEGRIRAHFPDVVPTDALMHLAWLYWKSGRTMLREGNSAASGAYFEEARRVYPADPVCGRGLYRAFNRIAGPINAERWLGAARAVSKAASGMF